MVSAIQFLRDTGKTVIEIRKSAMQSGEQVPDDILQRIIQQEGLLSFDMCIIYRLYNVIPQHFHLFTIG